ncbi:chromate transporter [Sulfobacillus sp. hq2]|uniref:chromate transporter n=1 Tax=Sulfobacillus sp. hq2 TaxID=2039167 RepID=UPI000CD14B2F|nr:chromate transporter [Sulfobacillus sp. hq2]POB10008.1 chromate transporter [Sulfobacillus sp. hq2]
MPSGIVRKEVVKDIGHVVALVLNFLWVGLLGFGGGFGMIPLMKSATLSHHWLSPGTFDQAIAMGQITPGPVAISATFIGERVAGPLGALVATIAVFTPSLVVIVVLSHWFTRLKKVLAVQNVLFATLAAVTGLIAGVAMTLGESLIHAWTGAVLALVVAIVALRWKVPYWSIILGAGVVGAIWFRP